MSAVNRSSPGPELGLALMNARPEAEIQELIGKKANPTSQDLTTAILNYSDAKTNHLVVKLLLNAKAKPTDDAVHVANKPHLQETAALLRQFGLANRAESEVGEDEPPFVGQDRPSQRSCWSYLFAPFIAAWSCVASIFSCIYDYFASEEIDL